MKPRPFDYARPDTVDEAVAVLAENGAEARVMAGGQSLMAMLNLRLLEPRVLVDITRIPALKGIEVKGGWVVVGAGVTQSQLLEWPRLGSLLPFVARALPWVGHFQTRNRGTICGSLCHADPSSEMPLSMALLGGEICLRSRRGDRWAKASEFQAGLLTVAKADDELAVAVRFPVAEGQGAAFREVARRHGDFAIVGAGIVTDGKGGLRVGVAGMVDRPHVAPVPAGLTGSAVADWANEVAWTLGGLEDIHASPRYRRDLLRRILPQLVAEVQPCTA
jgi:2-furoyl-CoA dehydrogenase FAD binding subunit